MEPIGKWRMYLTEVAPAGPKAGDQAEKVGTRLLHQVETHPRTTASSASSSTGGSWSSMSTRPGTYECFIRRHIRPALGSLPLAGSTSKLDAFLRGASAMP